MDIEIFLDLFEGLVILCFGIAWPISIRRSYISKTAKGKSLFFDIFMLLGCLFGALRRLILISVLQTGGVVFYLGLLVYAICFIEIIIDIVIYFRNKKIDKLNLNKENI